MTALFLLIALYAAGTPVRSAEPPRPLSPSIESIFPRGARQGSTVTVSIRGRYLENTARIAVSGTGVSASILENTDSEIKARFELAPDAPVQRRDVRVYTPQGTFVQVFDVSALPERLEREPNNELNSAERVELPVIINGTIPAGDYDHFRFHATAGQTLTFDFKSSRVGTRFDATLWLLDVKGREIAFEDDSYFDKDPKLIYRVPVSGEYVLRASGFRESGSSNSEYRLVIGDLPLLSYIFPAGAQRGVEVEVAIHGSNLDRVDAIRLDDSSTPLEILRKTPERIEARITAPTSTPAGFYSLRLYADNVPLPNPLPFVISEFREITLSGAPVSMPLDLSAPLVINGTLRTARQTDNFLVDVQAGQQIQMQGDAMSLGNFLDPAVTIYDAQGGLVFYLDEAAPNGFDKEPTTVDFRLTHTFELAGKYRIELRDAALRGRDSFVYRFLIGMAEPEFQIYTLTNQVSALPGQTATLPVRVRRSGGWDTPIEVWVDGLPARIESKRMTAEPANTRFRGTFSEDFFFDGTNVELPLQVHEGAPFGSYPLRVHARGTARGKTRQVTADVHYPWQQTGYLRGRADDRQMVLTVAKPPLFDLEAPASLRLTKGKTSEITLAVRWMGKEKPEAPLRIEAPRLPAGVEIEGQNSHGDKVTVTLRSTGASVEPVGWLSLVAILTAGRETYRKAAPDIEVRFVEAATAHELSAR